MASDWHSPPHGDVARQGLKIYGSRCWRRQWLSWWKIRRKLLSLKAMDRRGKIRCVELFRITNSINASDVERHNLKHDARYVAWVVNDRSPGGLMLCWALPRISRFVMIKKYALLHSWIVRDSGVLTLWRPLLPYGYSCKASCARPG